MAYDCMQLMKLARDPEVGDLLDAALEGPKTIQSVSDLYRFVVQSFGRDTESDVARKYWVSCGTYLANAGLTREQLAAVRKPYPKAGESGFKSILDELDEEGHEVPVYLMSTVCIK